MQSTMQTIKRNDTSSEQPDSEQPSSKQPDSEQQSQTRTIVVKLGTSVLTGGGLELDQARMVDLVRQCAALQSVGHKVIICTSAAIAVGRSRLGQPDLPPNIASKQLLAAVGQSRLMLTWERLFDIYGIPVGQILLTRSDVENRQRFLNARDALTALLEHNIIPIVNENDAVATTEIRVGDNDNLSALVATLVGADLLLLLTDQPGLFTADPRNDPDAELIPEVQKIDDTLRALAGDNSGSGLGVGGMATKLQAADLARRAGADVIIAAGHAPDVVLRALTGKQIGTRFPALKTRLDNRKQWILAGPKSAGSVQIDGGATKALCQNGRSLLPVGLVSVVGDFRRGDTVNVFDEAGNELARGLASYSSDALRQIIGCHSDEIVERIGYTYGPTVIHRDNLILLTD